MWVVKARDGETTGFLDYHWHGPSYTIGDALATPYQNHKDAITPKEN
jgi:hypothetical protein